MSGNGNALGNASGKEGQPGRHPRERKPAPDVGKRQDKLAQLWTILHNTGGL